MVLKVDLYRMATSESKKDKSIKLLANRVKSLRIKKGYTSYEYFAYDNNLSRSQYGRYEKGEDLRFSSLIKVIKAFKITPEEFFSEGFEDL
jgi:transcriptional regulator with XRE-family HTH domain